MFDHYPLVKHQEQQESHRQMFRFYSFILSRGKLHASLNNIEGAFNQLNEKQFIETLKENNIVLNDTQKEQFDKYYQLLVDWNKKVNLTAITEKKDVYLKHFYDSITPAFYVDFSQQSSICDVGQELVFQVFL